ncbi:Rad52/Rad22 family DNA repair protein, partial [Salmonella enterica subsp. enterica serovar Typhimurium]
MNLDLLDEPFAAEDIEWRIQQSGKTRDGKLWAMVLAYVTNRAI